MQRALNAGGRVHALVAQFVELALAPAAVEWRQSEQVVAGQGGRREPLRQQRERLSWRGHFSGHVGGGDRAFFNREQRLAGIQVEYEGETHLRLLNRHVTFFAVLADRRDQRVSRKVIVEDVVVDDLVVPDGLAGFRRQRHGRGCIRNRKRSRPPVEVRRCAGRRQKDQIALQVRAQRGPDIRRTGFVNAVRGDRIEFPLKFAGSHVKGTNESVAGVDDTVLHAHRGNHPVADHDGPGSGMPGSDAVAFEIPVGNVARVPLVRTEVSA